MTLLDRLELLLMVDRGTNLEELPLPRLLLELAISALMVSRSTNAACDFLSVFLTKLAMMTLHRMSTSSRR
jgi:hypothetical protein